MTSEPSFVRSLGSSRLVAVVVYATLIPLFAATIWVSVASTLDARHALGESEDLLDQLRDRRTLVNRPGDGLERTGSPFLEGPTVTVAGASLLQRIGAAVTKVGGTMQSSQVDVDGVQAKDGFVGLLMSLEVDQPALQRLIYDIEAGMPFLYIDQLDVQMPQASAANEAAPGRLRVVLGVSGQWRKSK